MGARTVALCLLPGSGAALFDLIPPQLMATTIKEGMGGANSTYIWNHTFRSPVIPMGTRSRPILAVSHSAAPCIRTMLAPSNVQRLLGGRIDPKRPPRGLLLGDLGGLSLAAPPGSSGTGLVCWCGPPGAASRGWKTVFGA
jgi:hypothetical protein